MTGEMVVPESTPTRMLRVVRARELAVPVVVALGCAVLWLWRARQPTFAEEAFRNLRMHRYAEAVAAFEQALSRRPDSTALRVGFARALAGQGESARALFVLDRAIASAPAEPTAADGGGAGDGELRALRGDLLARLGRVDEATAVFADLSEVFPDRLEHRVRHAELLEAGGRLREAGDALAAILEHRPDRSDVRMRLAWLCASASGAFADLRDVDRAEQLCLRALEDDRGRTPVVVMTAVSVARATGRSERVLERLEHLALDASLSWRARARLAAQARVLRAVALDH